jgi:hypothetical protein
LTVWERRDLPVLRALATSDDRNLQHGLLHLGAGATDPLGLDLPNGDVHDAILALSDADYVEGQVQYETGPGAIFTHLRVTGRGQQALGQWPLFDNVASPETLALLLERLAEEAPTDEEAANMRRAARYARTLGGAAVRAALTAATTQLVRAAAGLV